MLNGLYCADVPLSNYSLTHARLTSVVVNVGVTVPLMVGWKLLSISHSIFIMPHWAAVECKNTIEYSKIHTKLLSSLNALPKKQNFTVKTNTLCPSAPVIY